MSTTDPTPLAEQIAWEHRFVRKGWSSSDCSCDPGGHTYTLAGYAVHIATVTERAVRERVAAEIEARGHEPFCLAFPPGDEPCPCGLDGAARIARGDAQ